MWKTRKLETHGSLSTCGGPFKPMGDKRAKCQVSILSQPQKHPLNKYTPSGESGNLHRWVRLGMDLQFGSSQSAIYCFQALLFWGGREWGRLLPQCQGGCFLSALFYCTMSKSWACFTFVHFGAKHQVTRNWRFGLEVLNLHPGS